MSSGERKLPNWMAEAPKDDSKDTSKAKEAKRGGDQSGHRHYVMSPKELENAAKNVLKEKK